MSPTLPRWSATHLATASTAAALLLVAAAALAQDKDPGKKSADRPGSKSSTSTSLAKNEQSVEGVIVNSEEVGKGAKSRSDVVDKEKKTSPPTRQITVSTAAVWRDWVRDQAAVNVKANASPREIAERGANSIATRGEPRSADTEVIVDIGPNTKIETRFRASTDERTKGSKTPAGAREVGDDTSKEKGDRSARARSRAGDQGVTRFHADDLKSGLFVEVDYRHEDGRNLASSVTVIRPVGGPDTPAETGAEESKAAKGRK